MIRYISNSDHYKKVIALIRNVKHTLWLDTADIKDLYVKLVKDKKPFLALLALLIRKGVEIRLIHAKEPGQAFRDDFDKYPVLYDKARKNVMSTSTFQNNRHRLSDCLCWKCKFDWCRNWDESRYD